MVFQNYHSILCLFLSGAAAAPSTLINEVKYSSVKAGPMLPLTREKVALMAFAAELTQAVYYQGTTDCVPCTSFSCSNGPECDPHAPGWEALGYNELYGAELASGEAQFINNYNDVDANLFMDIGDYCFVTWRATLSFNMFNPTTWRDWFSRNADIAPEFVAPRGESTGQCQVHQGLHEAYQGGDTYEFRNENFEEKIFDFVDTCMGKGPHKQLVFAGHSQGAGAAMVGALRLQSYNPITISLAGAPILQGDEECPAINREHIWRVVNTENSGDGSRILYDIVPYMGLKEACTLGWVTDKGGKHIGSAIHLPPDSPVMQPSGGMLSSPLVPEQHNVAYWGPNEGVEEENYGPTADDLSFGNDMKSSVHWVETGYLPKLKALLTGPFPIDASGYIDGTRCTGGAECASKSCVRNTCGGSHAEAGTSCSEHSDCAAGYNCDWQLSILSSTCVPKSEDGAWCNENEDCISGKCSYFSGCY